jgi:hypothetical protein
MHTDGLAMTCYSHSAPENLYCPMDISITCEFGFHTLVGISIRGREFISEQMAESEDGTAFCDDIEAVEAIADAAVNDDLEVDFNGFRYLGAGVTSAQSHDRG